MRAVNSGLITLEDSSRVQGRTPVSPEAERRRSKPARIPSDESVWLPVQIPPSRRSKRPLSRRSGVQGGGIMRAVNSGLIALEDISRVQGRTPEVSPEAVESRRSKPERIPSDDP